MSEEPTTDAAVLEPDEEIVEAGAIAVVNVAPRGEIETFRGDVRTAALVAAGGVVAGAATVAMVRAAKGAGRRKAAKRSKGRERLSVVAKRSFLVDVSLLGD